MGTNSASKKRLVIKVGTRVITGGDRLLDLEAMRAIVDQIIQLKRQGIEVILVSSGAVASGRAVLGARKSLNNPIQDKQLLAAVGQVHLMETYSKLLKSSGYACAQVLATKEDFRDRHHYLCMRSCLSGLLHDNILPICNENDVVAIKDLMFTDNDELAGLIATMLDVDALYILTGVDGLFDRNPSEPDAKLISTVASHQRFQFTPKAGELSVGGRGGMHTKCKIAAKLSGLGITTHIFNGNQVACLSKIALGGEAPGTTFLPGKRAKAIKRWIAHAEGQSTGLIHINVCAAERLRSHTPCSLLPVGVAAIEGSFEKGDIISIIEPAGEVLGYGIAQYGHEAAKSCIGQKGKKALIHYDYLYLKGAP
ncbi:MAG: glutamate 5-kinase [Verrucomicrobia bacterium]|nr:glutamate 5-kinase [Verrucomicrobiota bacterium]